MPKSLLVFLLILVSFLANASSVTITPPSYLFEGIEQTIDVSIADTLQEATVFVNGKPYHAHFTDGEAEIPFFVSQSKMPLTIEVLEKKTVIEGKVIPLWWSIIPPLIAILLALLIKEVVISLLIGVFLGAAVLGYYTNGITGVFLAFFDVLDTYIIDTLNDWGHLAIILFTLIIGAMVSVISKNGGMKGVVNLLAKKATTARSGQLATWLLGVAIFFDDYANTLVVGNTMRPITDKLKISREKLAYLVDSTAAPIAALAFITTWIGAELSYIQSGIEKIPDLQAKESAYGIFFSSLQYSFYPILTLFFMVWFIYRKKEFGPMLKAERRARLKKEEEKNSEIKKDSEMEVFEPKSTLSPNPWNAILPVLTVIITTAVGLWITGSEGYVWDNDHSFWLNLSTIIGRADSFYALLWASFLSISVAVVLSVGRRLLSLQESIEAAINGIKTMLPAVIILTLAWALAHLTDVMHTADFLTGVLQKNVSVFVLPAITFLLAAVVSFSTGSSWGTMAILYPLIMPITWQMGVESGLNYDALFPIFANAVACVLAGSVLGDHCSPISDTTILSSLASGCNHIDHVRTQMPYALTTGGIAIAVGTLPTAFGFPSYLSFVIGFGAIILIEKFIGKTVKDEKTT